MKLFPDSVARLIAELNKLPGVGRRNAQKYAYYLIKAKESEALALADAIVDVKRNLKYCPVCGNFSDAEPCEICASRDRTVVCVVKEPKDILTMERMREFSGTYHVLFGTLNPLEGVGPEDLRIKELLARVSEDHVKEVVMATNPDVEGEATAMYLSRLLKPLGVRVTRLAQGISIGSDLEYADEVTLSQAFHDRREM